MKNHAILALLLTSVFAVAQDKQTPTKPATPKASATLPVISDALQAKIQKARYKAEHAQANLAAASQNAQVASQELQAVAKEISDVCNGSFNVDASENVVCVAKTPEVKPAEKK